MRSLIAEKPEREAAMAQVVALDELDEASASSRRRRCARAHRPAGHVLSLPPHHIRRVGTPDLALHVAAAVERAAERDLVGVLEVAADGKAAREPRHPHAVAQPAARGTTRSLRPSSSGSSRGRPRRRRSRSTRCMSSSMRRSLGLDAVERRERAAEHVVEPAVLRRPLERDEVDGLLDDADRRPVAPRVGADRAELLLGEVAALAAEADALLHVATIALRARAPRPFGTWTRRAWEREPLRRAAVRRCRGRRVSCATRLSSGRAEQRDGWPARTWTPSGVAVDEPAGGTQRRARRRPEIGRRSVGRWMRYRFGEVTRSMRSACGPGRRFVGHDDAAVVAISRRLARTKRRDAGPDATRRGRAPGTAASCRAGMPSPSARAAAVARPPQCGAAPDCRTPSSRRRRRCRSGRGRAAQIQFGARARLASRSRASSSSADPRSPRRRAASSSPRRARTRPRGGGR